MLSSVLDSLGGFLRPLAIAVLILIALGFMTEKPGATGTDGFACAGLTDNADLNRALCRMNPARLWNMPVADIVPGLRSGGNSGSGGADAAK